MTPKVWKSQAGVVYYRFHKNAIFMACCGVAIAYRLSPDGEVERSLDLAKWQTSTYPDTRHIREAIAALWPKPTKDQLWRKVARLAGELIFACNHSIAFNCSHPPAGIVRAVVRDARKFSDDYPTLVDKHRQEKMIAKLEKALAAWEAAE